MPYGQLVFGHPGSGKTTYCNGLREYLRGIGRRALIVNLDPANDALPYEAAVDVRDLIDHEVAMKEEGLGPNGAFLFCLEYLKNNQDWLQEELEREGGDAYLLFDCPGQIELYTNHDAFKSLVEWMQKSANVRLCAVHLVDSLYCRSGPHFISALLVSLSSMLQLELPHVNVLTKIDLLKNYELDFGLDFYTEVQDLTHLTTCMSTDPQMPKRFTSLNNALIQLVEDYPHVAFLTLDIEDKDAVKELMTEIDKANGYAFTPMQGHKNSVSQLASSAASTLQTDYLDRAYDMSRRTAHEELSLMKQSLNERLKETKYRVGCDSEDASTVPSGFRTPRREAHEQSKQNTIHADPFMPVSDGPPLDTSTSSAEFKQFLQSCSHNAEAARSHQPTTSPSGFLTRPPKGAQTPPPEEKQKEYVPDQNLVPCVYCARRFTSDRVAKHESVCDKGKLCVTPKRAASTHSTRTSTLKSPRLSTRRPLETKVEPQNHETLLRTPTKFRSRSSGNSMIRVPSPAGRASTKPAYQASSRVTRTPKARQSQAAPQTPPHNTPCRSTTQPHAHRQPLPTSLPPSPQKPMFTTPQHAPERDPTDPMTPPQDRHNRLEEARRKKKAGSRQPGADFMRYQVLQQIEESLSTPRNRKGSRSPKERNRSPIGSYNEMRKSKDSSSLISTPAKQKVVSRTRCREEGTPLSQSRSTTPKVMNNIPEPLTSAARCLALPDEGKDTTDKLERAARARACIEELKRLGHNDAAAIVEKTNLHL